jgi:CubicO group peptidase (beta-lactamase class C family)
MQRYVDGNCLAGFSSAVLVGRDLVDVKCIGWADKETRTPLRVDHIFRIFSNTKLITSCAALLLLEEGRFQLDDPIEQFIPQLAKRRCCIQMRPHWIKRSPPLDRSPFVT